MTVVALPNILGDLNFYASNILWVNLIYLCALVATCIPFAKLISKYGVKKSTMISLIALLISLLLTVFAVNQYMLLLSRLIQGLTCASLTSGIYIMIVAGLSESDVGSGLGIVGSAGYLGMLMASSFMGFMIYLASWRIAFLFLVPFIIIQLILLKNISFEENIDEKAFDIKGALLYGIIMALTTLGFESIDDNGLILILISLVIFAVFLKYENNIKNPIYNFKLFKDINYVIGNYAALATNFSVTIAVTALSFHLHYLLDIDEHIAGLILIISPVMMVITAPYAGKLSNKIDARLISAFSLLLIFVSMMIYAFMDRFPFEIILLSCAIQGLGTGMFSAPNNKFILTMVDKDSLPDASSLLATTKEFGKILSMSIFSVILSLMVGNQVLGNEYLDKPLFQSINIMMLICALISLSAALLLFYSRYKYKFESNPEVVKLFTALMPERIKKRFK